ncbi:MAG: dethiobiotin synthase [Terriglobia bacterium]
MKLYSLTNGLRGNPRIPMQAGLFITGTDTNVGKTVLSALLTAALDAVYWKPIQSGAAEGTDRQAVMRMAEIPPERTRPERYYFDLPVSPHLAARTVGVRIKMSEIALPDAAAPLIVEGAGGVLTPLNEKETILNLIAHLALPVIIASRTSLGTINHTVLTIQALRRAGAEVSGVVMLGDQNCENRRAVEHYGGAAVVGHVPRLPAISRKVLLEVFDAEFDQRCFERFRRAPVEAVSGAS